MLLITIKNYVRFLNNTYNYPKVVGNTRPFTTQNYIFTQKL